MFPNLDVSITCNSEVTYDRKSYFDATWPAPLPGKNNVNFAVLKSRTTEVLHRRDSLPGVCTPENERKKQSDPDSFACAILLQPIADYKREMLANSLGSKTGCQQQLLL